MADKVDDFENEDEKEPKITDKKKKNDRAKTHDPKKYIDLEPTLANNLYTVSESNVKSIVLTFGRFSPPTVGHEKLVNKVISEAVPIKAATAVYLSHTQDKKKNPLTYDEKLRFMTVAFGKIVKKTKARSLIEVLKEIQSLYDKVIVVVGADRVSEFSALLNKYNGKEFNFDNITVISAGERDPDADDVTGMSASKMRALAVSNDAAGFTSGLPKKLKSIAQEVFDTVRRGMKLMEDLEEEQLDEKVISLDFQARRKRAMTMKRYAGKIKRAKERALLRRSNPERVKMKARKRAIAILRKRLAGKRDYGSLSTSEKIMVDKRASRISDAAIDRVARKQVAVVRKIETDRMSHHNAPRGVNIKANEAFEIFSENFYSDIAQSGEQRQSLNKKKSFHSMYRKEGSVKTDARFRVFKPKLNENIEDISEETLSLMESVEEMYGESSEYTQKLIKQEAKHKKITKALKEFGERIVDLPKADHIDYAKNIINKHQLSFTPKQLVSLHSRVKNAKKFSKAWANVDAWESVQYEGVDDPAKREQGTDSLVKTYKDDTPGQSSKIDEAFENMFVEAKKPKGLWYNIHARRKKGLPPKKPGQEGYPKTLDIE